MSWKKGGFLYENLITTRLNLRNIRTSRTHPVTLERLREEVPELTEGQYISQLEGLQKRGEVILFDGKEGRACVRFRGSYDKQKSAYKIIVIFYESS